MQLRPAPHSNRLIVLHHTDCVKVLIMILILVKFIIYAVYNITKITLLNIPLADNMSLKLERNIYYHVRYFDQNYMISVTFQCSKKPYRREAWSTLCPISTPETPCVGYISVFS